MQTTLVPGDGSSVGVLHESAVRVAAGFCELLNMRVVRSLGRGAVVAVGGFAAHACIVGQQVDEAWKGKRALLAISWTLSFGRLAKFWGLVSAIVVCLLVEGINGGSWIAPMLAIGSIDSVMR